MEPKTGLVKVLRRGRCFQQRENTGKPPQLLTGKFRRIVLLVEKA
jgi:hypothetical protein